MKQFTLVIEAIIKENSEMIIVREPRSGQIVKVLDSPAELASFLNETISTLKTQNPNQNGNSKS